MRFWSTIKLSFADQPKKFSCSRLQLLTRGHKGLAISQISTILRSIVAVPSNAVFCTCPGLTIIPTFWSDLLRPPRHLHFLHSPRRCYLTLEILIFLIFSPPFELTMESSVTATPIIQQTLSCFPHRTKISGLLDLIMWSHCMLKNHNTLILSVSNTLWGWSLYHLSALPTHSHHTTLSESFWWHSRLL